MAAMVAKRLLATALLACLAGCGLVVEPALSVVDGQQHTIPPFGSVPPA